MSKQLASIDMQLLQRLHTLWQTRSDLQTQLKRGPLQQTISERASIEMASKIETLAADLKSLQIKADDKQLQLSQREQRIVNHEAKLNTAASNREYQTLKDEIAADKQANEVLSDEILELLESIDQSSAELAELRGQYETEQAAHQERVQAIDTRMQQVEVDLARIVEQLATTEKAIPASMKVDYQRLVKALGEEAFASLDDQSCGGCQQVLTTQWIDRLRMSKLVRCPGCDAFLYLPQSNRV